jgi:hypothetical protein
MSDDTGARLTLLEKMVRKLMAKGSPSGKTITDFSVATSTGVVTLTTAYQDVPGVTFTITPTVPEYWYVWAYVQFDNSTGTAPANAGDSFRMQLIDSVLGAQTEQGYPASGSTGEQGGAVFFKLAMTAVAHTLKMQTKNLTGARGTSRYQCQIALLRVPQ